MSLGTASIARAGSARTPKPRPAPVPTEHQEQVALMQWARRHAYQYPELRLLHAIPNGEKRSRSVANRLKLEGVSPGVPDLFLPAARIAPDARLRHGLYIELKRQRGGSVSPEQKAWHVALRAQGYEVVVAKGWEAAVAVIRRYLGASEANQSNSGGAAA
ncbi:MAG: VRR-NUC domain-containing protein [Proteobacteria bacterium]|nr:VRR-NUC domain-containing protein [Pseudomonadota bacterium]